MKNRKTGKWAALFIMSWLVAGLARASVVYQDTFTVDGSLAGRAVEIGTGNWQTHAEMMTSGGVARPAATAPAKVAALPFNPETNMIYTLSADVNAISNSWVALGFLSETNSGTIAGNGYFFSYVDTESPWMYTVPNGTVATLTGPAAGGYSGFSGTGSNGTLQVVLDTSGSNWKAIYSFNGTALRTNTFSGSLNITHVAFGGNPTSIQEVDNFMLEATAAPAGPTVYDDFSSGDLSKWIFTPGSPQRTDPTVVGGELNWTQSATPGWGVETLVSTQSDFDLTRSVANPLELSFKLVTLTPRSDAAAFDSFSFGWMDASGDILQVKNNFRADSTGNNSVIQFFYNGIAFGGNWGATDYLYDSGDIIMMSMDDAGFTLYRDRSGTVVTVGTVAFSDPTFTGTGSIYFNMNNQGLGAAATFDDISTKATAGYARWAGGWGVDIGAETNDFDNDGLNNLYEYGLGGDPTDEFDQGTAPVFGIADAGGSNVFSYVYPQLSDPVSGLAYSLALSSDLVVGTWATNTGYTVLGTNVTGNALDFVTNVTDTVDGEKYIRLIIESL